MDAARNVVEQLTSYQKDEIVRILHETGLFAIVSGGIAIVPRPCGDCSYIAVDPAGERLRNLLYERHDSQNSGRVSWIRPLVDGSFVAGKSDQMSRYVVNGGDKPVLWLAHPSDTPVSVFRSFEVDETGSAVLVEYLTGRIRYKRRFNADGSPWLGEIAGRGHTAFGCQSRLYPSGLFFANHEGKWLFFEPGENTPGEIEGVSCFDRVFFPLRSGEAASLHKDERSFKLYIEA